MHVCVVGVGLGGVYVCVVEVDVMLMSVNSVF